MGTIYSWIFVVVVELFLCRVMEFGIDIMGWRFRAAGETEIKRE